MKAHGLLAGAPNHPNFSFFGKPIPVDDRPGAAIAYLLFRGRPADRESFIREIQKKLDEEKAAQGATP